MGLLRAVARALLVAVIVVLGVGRGVVASARQSEQATVHSMVVDARRSAQLPTVSVDRLAARIAARHSVAMAGAGRIFHNERLGPQATAAGMSWDVIGENVGVGASVQQVQRTFMSSRSHRHNILDGRYTVLGVGIVHSSDDVVYVTQVFARTRSSDAVRSSGGCTAPRRAEDGSTVSASFYVASCA